MEQRREERHSNGVPKFVKSSQVKKLPLAPIVCTPTYKKPNATRRGISIFSPTQVQPKPEPDLALTAGPSTPGPSGSKNPPPPFSNAVEIKYRECLKNHFARSGGHVVDGCGEFMPGGDVGTEESLICDACDCHRNFHRKEVVPLPPQSPKPPNNAGVSGPNPLVNFRGGASESSDEEQEDTVTGVDFGNGNGTNKRFRTKFNEEEKDANGTNKRFRTKFSEEQKNRMNKIAEKLGWRIQKKDEEEVDKACGEIGVSREVFRVYMNNCKQAAKRRRCI